jgi:hypothetical protein
MQKFGDGDSIAIGDTYTGSVLNRLNQNLVTEQGWLGLYAELLPSFHGQHERPVACHNNFCP